MSTATISPPASAAWKAIAMQPARGRAGCRATPGDGASSAIAAPTAASARATRSGSCRPSAASRRTAAEDRRASPAPAMPGGRRRPCLRPSVRLLAARRRSRRHPRPARRARLPSQCRRRAARRPRLRIEPARPAARGDSRRAARPRPHACARRAAGDEIEAGPRAGRRAGRDAAAKARREPCPLRRSGARPQMRRLGRLFGPHRQSAGRPDRRPRGRRRRHRDPHRDPGNLRRRAAADGARAPTSEVFDRLVALVNDFKRYFLRHGQPVSENPSPGNIAGGITTLEEKSLGAVQKAGRAPVTDVLRYGERVRRRGLACSRRPATTPSPRPRSPRPARR